MNASDPPPLATEAATLLLREYCEHREQFRIFEDFDAAMAAMQASVDKNLDQTVEPLKSVAQRLFKVSRDAFFLIEVCEWKITYIAKALLHTIETRNHLSLANNTRALIEHMAALVFILESLGKLRNSSKDREAKKQSTKPLRKRSPPFGGRITAQVRRVKIKKRALRILKVSAWPLSKSMSQIFEMCIVSFANTCTPIMAVIFWFLPASLARAD